MVLLVVWAGLCSTFTPLFTFLAAGYLVAERYTDTLYFEHVSKAAMAPPAMLRTQLSHVAVALPMAALFPVSIGLWVIPDPALFGPFNALLVR